MVTPGWQAPHVADRDQLGRLAAFRAAHPEVVIGDDEFGTWIAVIINGNVETVKNGHTLRELLDKLDAIFPSGSEAQPGGGHAGDPDG